MHARVPHEAADLIAALCDGVLEALGDNVAGIYLRGSIALGGFDPATSDVDVLVVTTRPVSEPEFAALSALHERLPARNNVYGRNYEVSYVDAASIRRFAPGERRHPTVGSDWAFGWWEHRDNWVLERWTVRERGVAVAGPDPTTLIDAVSRDELISAAHSEIRIRLEDWARDGEEPPDWLRTRYYQAFEIETVCRALYTIERGELPTKRQAIEWALHALPPRWRGLAEWSRAHHGDRTPDTSMFPEIVRFVLWAAAREVV